MLARTGQSSRGDLAPIASVRRGRLLAVLETPIRRFRGMLADLENLKAPVDRAMFSELAAGERRLGPAEPVYSETSEVEVDPGLVVRTNMGGGFRRSDFKSLRDMITKYRRAWAEAHLEGYLRSRAEGDVREAALAFYKKSAKRGGKPPTPKQFANVAALPTNRWFGGDVSLLYRALAERWDKKAVTHSRLVPEDARAFVESVYAALGGVEVGPYPSSSDENSTEEHSRKVAKNHRRSELAHMALDFLRLEEALGRSPTLKDIGRSGFQRRAEEVGLGSGVEEAWGRYERIVRQSLTSEVPPQQGQRSEKRATSEHSKKPKSGVSLGIGDRVTELSEKDVDESEAAPASNPQPTPNKSWWRRLIDR
jgi:hypothetical protein